MARSADLVADVVIFGGGIAGLWLLDRLRADGYSVVLLEAGRLGGGQSVASQGIIHGGAKYTLGFGFDGAVRELREMPSVWRSSLEGRSGPDLAKAKLLSQRTHLWIPSQLGGGLIGAFSRLVMRSRVRALPRPDWPEALNQAGGRGAVYALDEVVVDVPSVLSALEAAHHDCIRRIPDGVQPNFEGGCAHLGELKIEAQRFVFAAGGGNEKLLAQAGLSDWPHRRRPLHQLMLGGVDQPLYAHCVGKNPKPLATVTTHPTASGEGIWYVGGLMAEDGVGQSAERLIEHARRRLPELFPAVDFDSARWATFPVDRAEGIASSVTHLGGPIFSEKDEFLAVWPTKLALAPALTERVRQRFADQRLQPLPSNLEALALWDRPEVARPPWEEAAWID
ncbi:MAG: hypothetical protein CBC48_03525 [bacterium TMED88]|nr:hypothetical protein [Deltaproteobacteria bacterium]OUV35647.1 MAG: hypothetical protein CBC48_03525 [bacterium TMED88]